MNDTTNHLPNAEKTIPRFFRVMLRYREGLLHLSKFEAGELLIGLLEYTATGEVPKFTGSATQLAFAFIRPEIDADIERQRKINAKRRAAVQQRWNKNQHRCAL